MRCGGSPSSHNCDAFIISDDRHVTQLSQRFCSDGEGHAGLGSRLYYYKGFAIIILSLMTNMRTLVWDFQFVFMVCRNL